MKASLGSYENAKEQLQNLLSLRKQPSYLSCVLLWVKRFFSFFCKLWKDDKNLLFLTSLNQLFQRERQFSAYLVPKPKVTESKNSAEGQKLKVL